MAGTPAHRRRTSPFKKAALAPLKRPSDPVDLDATPYRVYLLHRIHAGEAKWYRLAGWTIAGVQANAHVFDFERAHWIQVEVIDKAHRELRLSERGREVAGVEDGEPS